MRFVVGTNGWWPKKVKILNRNFFLLIIFCKTWFDSLQIVVAINLITPLSVSILIRDAEIWMIRMMMMMIKRDWLASTSYLNDLIYHLSFGRRYYIYWMGVATSIICIAGDRDAIFWDMILKSNNFLLMTTFFWLYLLETLVGRWFLSGRLFRW